MMFIVYYWCENFRKQCVETIEIIDTTGFIYALRLTQLYKEMYQDSESDYAESSESENEDSSESEYVDDYEFAG